MTDQVRIAIQSEGDLKKHAFKILRRIESNERGGLLYLLNPVFALQDAGFDLSIDMRRHLKRALRYGTDTKKQLRKLERDIAKDIGHDIHAASNSQVATLLFDELGLAPPSMTLDEQHEDLPEEAETYESELELAVDKDEGLAEPDYTQFDARQLRDQCEQRNLGSSGPKKKLIARLEKSDKKRPPRPLVSLALLEQMRDAHPVVPKLIELRMLLRDGWQFVNRQTYEKVKAGSTVTLLRGVKFRRRKDAKPGNAEGVI